MSYPGLQHVACLLHYTQTLAPLPTTLKKQNEFCCRTHSPLVVLHQHLSPAHAKATPAVLQ